IRDRTVTGVQTCALPISYGAGLYAFSGPAFEPDATIALPQAMIAVMGPEAAVNAVYFNKIQEKPESERAAYVQKLREEYKADIRSEERRVGKEGRCRGPR